ncbi:MAG: hypothetical protein A2Y33_11955 [Spirochaetes bacterium GWF1_51_8]|nr:MAG: hypothetical protein A2Y33_11955 [Spirochaetes bacterium GWF1_51_8]
MFGSGNIRAFTVIPVTLPQKHEAAPLKTRDKLSQGGTAEEDNSSRRVRRVKKQSSLFIEIEILLSAFSA